MGQHLVRQALRGLGRAADEDELANAPLVSAAVEFLNALRGRPDKKQRRARRFVRRAAHRIGHNFFTLS